MEALVWETAEELDKSWRRGCGILGGGERFRRRNFLV